MKQSTYIDYLISELGNHLWRATDNERNSYHSFANNPSNQGKTINYRSKNVKDLFDLYLNELEFTPAEFLNSLKDNKRFTEFLYSSYYSYISDRIEIQKIFEPVIRKDLNLFNVALKQCLDTHHTIYDQAEQQPDNKDILAQLERNTEIFKNLLNIGEDEHLFKKLPKDSFYTKNSEYKKIMQAKGLFDNEKFEENKLINLFQEYVNNPRNKSPMDKAAEYCLFYIKDIVEKFDSPATFTAWAKEHIITKDKQTELKNLIYDKKFFSLITDDVNAESQVYQDKFIDQWMSNAEFRPLFFEKYSSDISFLKIHPHKIIDFLELLTSKEIIGLINKGIGDLDFEKSYHDFRDFLTKIPLEQASPKDHADIITHLIEFRKEIVHSDDVMKDNAFFSAALNHLVAKSLKIIKSSQITDEDKLEFKLKVLKVYLNNDDILVSLIHNSPNAINKNIQNLDTNLKEVRFNNKELNLAPNFFDNLESIASSKLEIYFLKQNDKNSYNYMNNLITGLHNVASTVSALGIYPVLDKLNLLDLKINKEIKNYETKRTKHIEDYPALFEILERHNDKGIISWVLQEKHIPMLTEKITYKNKNIVEFFSSFQNDKKGSKPPIIESIFEELMNNKSVLKELVLSKKKTLKTVKEIESDFIQKSLTVASLDNSLKNKEEPVVKVSRKI